MSQATRKERHQQLERRVQAALRRAREHRQSAVLARLPRYDEVFVEGVAWLDRLAYADEWPAPEPES